MSCFAVKKTIRTALERLIVLRHATGMLTRGLPLLASALFLAGAVCAQTFTLGFPVAKQNPYTAPIVSVLDHSATIFYEEKRTGRKHTSVEAYTGEKGERVCGPSVEPCGYYNLNFSPQNDSDTLQFIVNGAYTGTSADCSALGKRAGCLDQTKVLNYRTHSGYDYACAAPYTSCGGIPIELGTLMVAPADGWLYVPAGDPVNSWGSDPWCDFHTFYIDHGNGWSTWYLHAANLLPETTPHLCGTPVDSDQLIRYVRKGEQIAVVGSQGARSPHLHFEVRHCNTDSQGKIAVQSCKVVDPYGWEWITSDPISQNNLAAMQAEPLWNLAEWNLRQPLVGSAPLTKSSSGFSATIAGQNFDPGALVTLWNRQGQYRVATITPSSPPTATQIIVQLPNSLVSDPGEFVLKVQNPQGPRSSGKVLSLPVGTSSVPLLLTGQPAPGGGTFAGFNGFWSFTNRGEAVFGAGIDTNGSGTASFFADFVSSAGQKTKVSAPGFGNISSAATHVRMNNRGDLAFGDVNGIYGGLPAGIYVLKAGSSTPTTAVTWGQPCPSPCPLTGSPTIYQLIGPEAFSDAGDVAFAASLLDQQTNIGTCCFLFLYSGTDGTIIKVAADGPAGDATPVGGTFASGTLLFPITQITAGGDVIFLAQVTGGSSPGGIFRFSRSKGLSKVVVQGDPAPLAVGGVLGYPLFGRVGSASGLQLVFHAPVSGGSTSQVIAVIKDVTANSSSNMVLVAYQGEATGTGAGGSFSNPDTTTGPNLPFGYFGQNTAPPCIRSDGAVVFHSLLTGAQASGGSSTTEGIFIWNGLKFQKIVVDGDQVSSGLAVQGVFFAPVINDLGEVLYFVATMQ